MKPVRTALIGCGKVGHLHAAALRELPESHFVAACDASPDRARAFGVEYRVADFTDPARMFEQAGVEAVLLATPHPLHAAHAVLAAEHGAHVLVEKPMAATLADCDAMIASARRSGVQLGVISQRRLFEPVLRMKAAIDQGKIGRPVLGLVLMFSWRDGTYYASDPWRGKWATEGGGVLVNQSPHQLDILQWLMGPVEEISGYWANLNHPYVEVEDTALANIRFRNGGLGSLVLSLAQKPGLYTKVHIHGSNGASVGVQTDSGASFIAGMSEITEPPLNDIWTIPGEESRLGEFEAQDRARFREIHPTRHYHSLQIADFLHAIREGRSPLVTGEDGRVVVEMFTAIYRSSRDRAPVRFPLAGDDSGRPGA